MAGSESAPDRQHFALHANGSAHRANKDKSAPGSGVLRFFGHKSQLVSHSAELRKRTGVHLAHRPAAVDLHCGFRDADIAGNLFAKATLRDLNHDLALSGA
jgi:hypothetical protein